MLIKSILPLLLVLSFLNSCTVTGLVVGSKIAKTKNEKRPTCEPAIFALDSLAKSTWLEIKKKNRKKAEGEFVKTDELVGENNEIVQVLVLDVIGQFKHSAIPLSDIDEITLGRKSKGPKLLGTSIGLLLDGLISTILAYEINEAFGGH